MVYYKCTSFKLALNNFKKVKENKLMPFRKRKRLRKTPLIADNLKKKLLYEAETVKKMLYEVNTVKIKPYEA